MESHSDEAARIWRLNLQLSTELLKEAASGIEALGLEPKEFFVLDAVEERPYPAELARGLSMPKPTMTLYLRSLQAKGFLARGIDAQDLRRHRLELTAAGRETLTRARAILTSCYGERLVRLSSHEQSEFARLLQKLTEQD
jgi:DNA-binding MarR family transcriptional regulator